MNSFAELDIIEEILMIESKQAQSQQQPQRVFKLTAKPLREIDTNRTSCGNKKKRQAEPSKIEIRNARERNRVRVVNDEYEKLRRLILNSDYCRRKIHNLFDEEGTHGKKLSKLKILRLTIEYIQYLSWMLDGCDKV